MFNSTHTHICTLIIWNSSSKYSDATWCHDFRFLLLLGIGGSGCRSRHHSDTFAPKSLKQNLAGIQSNRSIWYGVTANKSPTWIPFPTWVILILTYLVTYFKNLFVQNQQMTALFIDDIVINFGTVWSFQTRAQFDLCNGCGVTGVETACVWVRFHFTSY